MIRVVVGVLTHEVFSSGRADLLDATVASVVTAFPGCPVIVMDNGSFDGTRERVAELSARGVTPALFWEGPGKYGIGRGRNALQRQLSATDADLFVMSDDDMLWRPHALEALRDFWDHAPNDVAILCGLLEPVWHWNTPREAIEHGGQRALVRDSAPAAAWTYRRFTAGIVFPVVEAQTELGEDYEACARLRSMGLRVAQTDLAEHAGWGRSTHGNEANRFGRPLDRDKWGV